LRNKSEHNRNINTNEFPFRCRRQYDLRQKNKGISAISYNPLDLIQQVTYNLTNFVQYHYTASGSKLRQTVYSDGLASKTTDYAGRFVTKRFEIAYYHKEEKNSAEILKS
jgi:hypothetical protein